MPYQDFFGLEREPFSTTPSTDFYLSTKENERILGKLRYCAENMRGLGVCMGRPGTGKTMLARRLLGTLERNRFEAALLVIVHSDITADWLLKRIALQLGVKNPSPQKLTLLSQLFRRLIKIKESGKKTVVLIDEAQMLHSRELMEEFRGLLNLEIPGSKLISFIFFGLEELDDTLRIDEPLRQRVAVRCRLGSLDHDSTVAYVRHRLERAGARRPIFSEGALTKIFEYSGGTPRSINMLADNALFEAALSEIPDIGEDLIRSVADELGLIPAVDPAAETPIDAPIDPGSVNAELAEIDALLAEMERY